MVIRTSKLDDDAQTKVSTSAGDLIAERAVEEHLRLRESKVTVQIQDLLNSYGGIAALLATDLVVIFLMTYVLYSAAIGARTCSCPTSH